MQPVPACTGIAKAAAAVSFAVSLAASAAAQGLPQTQTATPTVTGGRPALSSPVTLGLSFDQMAERNDQTVVAASGASLGSGRTRLYSNARAEFDVNGRGRRWTWRLGTDANARFYSGSNVVVGESADGGLTRSLGRTAQLNFSGGAGYSPFYAFSGVFLPGGGISSQTISSLSSVTPTAAATASTASTAAVYVRRSVVTSYLSAGYTVSVGRRSTLSVSGGGTRTDFLDNTAPSNQSWNAQGRYQHELTRNLGMHLGYSQRQGRYSLVTGTQPVSIGNIDAGLDYGRAFAFSRSLSFRFGTGSDLVRDGFGNLKYRVSGNASLEQSLGRAGRIGLSYQRRTDIIDGFARPVLVDSLSPVIDLVLGRRLGWTVSGGYSTGHVGTVTTADNRYRSYHATTGIRVPLTQRMSWYVDYLYYHHTVGQNVLLLGPISRVQQRQTLRTGVAVRLPLAAERPIGGT